MNHGSRTTYVKGCRCKPCRQANAAYAHRHQVHTLQVLHGTAQPRLVPTDRALVHIAHLRQHGMGYKAIAKEAKIARSIVARLIGIDKSRPANRITTSTEKAILSVRPISRLINPTIPSRKLQALVALGWSQLELARRLDLNHTNIKPIITGERQIFAATAQEIDRLFRELENTPGPSERSRLRAINNGWLPPAAWDDIEDLTERPNREHLRRPSKRSKLHPEDLAELVKHGWTNEAIAAKYDLKISSVDRAIFRHKINTTGAGS